MGSGKAHATPIARPHGRCRWFAFGNIVTACILVCADLAIPLQSLWLHVPIAAEVLALWASGFAVLYRQGWSVTLLRIAARALLCFGWAALAMLALSTAFLFGVHGHFLRDGLELVVIGFGLVIPYTVAYPMLLLAMVKPAEASSHT